jgi:hypothetical protein
MLTSSTWCVLAADSADDQVSTNASTPLAEIVSNATRPDQKFFMQLYVDRNRPKTEKLLEQINALGMKAIFVTVDAAAPGKREADERSRAEIEVVGLDRVHWLIPGVGRLGRQDRAGRQRRRDRAVRWRLHRPQAKLGRLEVAAETYGPAHRPERRAKRGGLRQSGGTGRRRYLSQQPRVSLRGSGRG